MASRPFVVTKCESLIPNFSAFWFILSANAAVLPASFSASATAAPLALRSMRAYRSCSTVTTSPALTQALASHVVAAFCEMVTGVLRSIPDSRTRIAVIILVVDAMGLRVCAFRSYSTLPVSMLSTIAAGDFMVGAVPPKSPRSEALTSKLSVCEAAAGSAETGATVVVVPSAPPESTDPTTASTTTNKRSGRSRPRLIVETLIGASIAYTSGLTASD